MRWLRRLLGIPPAPKPEFDHTEAFSPEARKWLRDNREPPMVLPTSFEERDVIDRRRRNEEADRRRRRDEQRRRDDDDVIITSAYTPSFDHTPSKTYSTGGHDHRDHCTTTTHDTSHSYTDSGSCGSDGGGCGGCD
jgi:hypothetical protein